MAAGSAATHSEQRRRMRRSLESKGIQSAEIERRVEEMRLRQLAERQLREQQQWQQERDRAAWEQRRASMEAEVYSQPDDSRHRPSQPDSLRTGRARAAGITARVVGRQHTITRWQYDEVEAGRSGR